DAVASGEYASAGEVVRDALRDWKVKHRLSRIELDEMRQLVQEGADSGPRIDADLVFARLRAKTRSASIPGPLSAPSCTSCRISSSPASARNTPQRQIVGWVERSETH